MPWAIAIRLLARLAASLFFWRMATRRRTAQAGGQAVPGSTPKARIDAQAAVMAVKTSILLTWRALLTATFLSATAVFLVSGLTIVVLGPRWLGAILLAIALATAMGNVVRRPRTPRRRADAQPAPAGRAAPQDGRVLGVAVSCAAAREGGPAPPLSFQLVSACVRASILSRSLRRCQIRCGAGPPSHAQIVLSLGRS